MRAFLITLSLFSAARAGALADQPIWQSGVQQPHAGTQPVPVPTDRPTWTFPPRSEQAGNPASFTPGSVMPTPRPALSGGVQLPGLPLGDQPRWDRQPIAEAGVATPAQDRPLLLPTTAQRTPASQATTSTRATSQVTPTPAVSTRTTAAQAVTTQRTTTQIVTKTVIPASTQATQTTRTIQTTQTTTRITAQATAGSASQKSTAGTQSVSNQDMHSSETQIGGAVQGPWMSGPPRVTLYEGGGISRLQVQLPPGTRWSVQPDRTGFNLNLSGAWAGTHAPQAQWKRTGEVSDIATRAVTGGWNIRLATAAPVRQRGSWRIITPQGPQIGGGAVIALDLSPALGERRALSPQDLKVRVQAPARPIYVTLDPGHGGRDPGAVGSVVEKEVVFNVATRTAGFLRAWGVQVRLTRQGDHALSENKATDLWMRSQLGKGQHAFVSIHANAMPANGVLKGYGTETWYMGRNGSFARLLQGEMSAVAGTKDLGVKSRVLGVLATNPAPAALVEIGFVSHPVDGENLQSEAYLSRVAFGIARGVLRQVGVAVPEITALPVKPEFTLSPLPPMPALPALPLPLPGLPFQNGAPAAPGPSTPVAGPDLPVPPTPQRAVGTTPENEPRD